QLISLPGNGRVAVSPLRRDFDARAGNGTLMRVKLDQNNERFSLSLQGPTDSDITVKPGRAQVRPASGLGGQQSVFAFVESMLQRLLGEDSRWIAPIMGVVNFVASPGVETWALSVAVDRFGIGAVAVIALVFAAAHIFTVIQDYRKFTVARDLAQN